MTRYTGVYAFPETGAAARRLAAALGLPCHMAELHRFPDGESLVRLPEPVERAVLYRSLDRPNDKLVELMLAASVLRRQGAAELCLVAPYMAYMRQDAVFRPGEPVSQAVVGAWLAQQFDRVVCVEPHLHRTGQLAEVFPGRTADALSAAPVVAAGLRAAGLPADTVILGPDEESAPLIAGVAGALGLARAVGRKERRGDRDVTVALPADAPALAGRPVVIVDDVISSGETILSCAAAARGAGAAAVRAVGVHALFGPEAAERFAAAGIPVLSCDGVPHPTNALGLAPLLAEILRR
ncbi:ribose-phosphate diphosphokinase [Azospirillum halopraeferens]|uniref:ribose-phosphate diphosphokinase n=1 Tax=Azospirillum halopraeferens TaxID=34010 RepID=UPI0004028FB0|nr:ribose-phosphate diphosphokinase [Azospirillum halopraeferens]